VRPKESPNSKVASKPGAMMTRPPESGMNRVLVTNIQTLLAKREAEERQAGLDQKVADRITRFVGSMSFVYLHLAIFGAWIVINLGWTGIPPFDPSFVILAMAASVEAIFLSTFVLISQNRLSGVAERRADFDLQISLLVEHEVTRLLQRTRTIAEHMGIECPDDHETRELEQDVEPGRVLDTLERESKLKQT
jgi:uncharacterized membrane protein